jgi:pyruvate dehydrogenase E2 component (dihydrolipoamide acetyltransferase)
MPINILMPALSPTMEKGNLAKWLKKEGDKVAAGDIIAEIETDKATMEFEAVDEGTLAKILVPEGSTDVPVNQPIAVLAGEGEDVKAAGQSAPAQPAAQSEAKPESKSKPASPAQAPAQAAAPAAASQAPAQRPQDGANRVFASPLARRLARDKGIDIGSVAGSGPHGRVIARDLEGAQPGAPARAPAAPAAAAAAPAARPASAEAPSDDKIRALFEPGSYEVIPHDGMRRTIARRLVEAKQTIPHFYLTIDCNIGKLLAAREEINRSAPKDKDGKPAFKLSVNDFVIKALAVALQRVPDANVTWTEGGMLKHKRSDVGVAVSIPGGLITPVIRAADIKSLSVISNEMRDLAARARARKLKPNEYEGGATAVSNLGMYGIKDFAAVINPPQATILAVGAGEERAIVRDGKIEAGWVMSATLSCDHRAVDGALGAELLSAFKALIENPLMLAV